MSPNSPASKEQQYVPARTGSAVYLTKRQTIRVINTPGTQVVDTWAVDANQPSHHMSMQHSRAHTLHLSPHVGDVLVTNTRTPILQVLADTSPGIHDTLIAACDKQRYELLGVKEYHQNCSDNFHSALKKLSPDISSEFPTPSPLNLFMNIPIFQSRPGDITSAKLDWGTSPCQPGDFVVFRALMDCIFVMSACPQDIIKINHGEPKDVHFIVDDPADLALAP